MCIVHVDVRCKIPQISAPMQTMVDKYAPQISGEQNRDSHELLAFLLDCLHEDLNLVRGKPHVDMTIQTEGREEKVWGSHLHVIYMSFTFTLE